MLVRFRLSAQHPVQMGVVGSAPVIGAWKPEDSVRFEHSIEDNCLLTPQLEISTSSDAKEI